MRISGRRPAGQRFLAGAIALAALLGSCASAGAASRTRSAALAPAHAAAVSMVEPPFQPPRSWSYQPADLTVRVGESVTWSNTGAVAHTVTADDGKAFDSGSVDPNGTFSFRATSPGTFLYHCTFHPWMKGTLTVSA